MTVIVDVAYDFVVPQRHLAQLAHQIEQIAHQSDRLTRLVQQASEQMEGHRQLGIHYSSMYVLCTSSIKRCVLLDVAYDPISSNITISITSRLMASSRVFVTDTVEDEASPRLNSTSPSSSV